MEIEKEIKILIIEDEDYNRHFYAQILDEQGYAISMAATLEEGALQCKKENPALVLLDLKFDRGESQEGLLFLKKIKNEYPELEVVVISGSQRDATKIEAILKYGAYDFLEKPIRRDVLILVVKRVLERIRLNRENRRLKKNLALAHQNEGFFNMIGQSRSMKAMFRKIEKVAPFDSTVLITGETGTGKELVARAIYKLSKRKPLVSIDLGMIPKELTGSELFGHQRGAFTGATTDRKGKIEVAGSGTVFLDEVENISSDVQQQLLRLLEQRSYHRLGSNDFRTTNARFVVATNMDLKEKVNSGQFRQDLYHRLNVINIHIPPLRERRADIELLALYFLKIHSKSLDIYKKLTPGAVKRLLEYDWPGNVRELKNAIEEALIFGLDENEVVEDDFQFSQKVEMQTEAQVERTDSGVIIPLKQAEQEAKKEIIQRTLKYTNGVMTKAARLLEITPRHLKRLLDEYAITQ